ncbi:DNA phosphorothioation-associated protein 4 [Thalassomonas sp. M1454]|uniref:DNA phosphorothioation-associated protein 4 n=1 Tax=Thalassomonas sp. M1454 TaxID=2594477 RepID=UPI00117F75DB|nr:DNA phosphorothioation-associated protein 4 [Thalassomonas sp. M1454]TRX56688.1 DNA phosphorothioation-associated protein 4 [Thalassomonas sp. M1454]
MMDRVKRPANFEHVFKCLKDEENIFSSYKDILIFAACLAKSRNSKPLQFSKSSEPIPLHVFNSEYDQVVIYTIAMAHFKTDQGIKLLSDDNINERIKIFEEYAAAGLSIIDQEILKSGNKNIDCLSDFILLERNPDMLLDQLDKI